MKYNFYEFIHEYWLWFLFVAFFIIIARFMIIVLPIIVKQSIENAIIQFFKRSHKNRTAINFITILISVSIIGIDYYIENVYANRFQWIVSLIALCITWFTNINFLKEV